MTNFIDPAAAFVAIDRNATRKDYSTLKQLADAGDPEAIQALTKAQRQRELGNALVAKSLTTNEPTVVGGNVMRQNVGGDILSGFFGNAINNEADKTEAQGIQQEVQSRMDKQQAAQDWLGSRPNFKTEEEWLANAPADYQGKVVDTTLDMMKERSKPTNANANKLHPIQGADGKWFGVDLTNPGAQPVPLNVEGRLPEGSANKLHPIQGADGQWYGVDLVDRNAEPVKLKVQGRLPNENRDRVALGYDADGNAVAVNLDSATSRPVPGVSRPPDAQTVKGRHEAITGVNAIDDALAAIDKAPDALGLAQGTAGATELGATLLNKMSTQEEIEARAAVANIGSQIVHDRSGAAVTLSETPRLKPFIPSASDNATVAKAKLKKLRERMAAEGYTWGVKAGSLNKPAAPKTVKRTGTTKDGRKVIEYTDGTREYK
jgi:hypothetical protein